jgi:type IV pilus assembly protein PilF
MKVALDVVQTALRAEPHNVAALTVEALIYTAIKDMAAAKETFALALQLAPGDPDLNHNYGVYLCQTERPAEAITYFDRALSARMYAHQANSYASKASCMEQLGKRDEARKQYLAALKVDQFHPSALYGLANMDYADGRVDAARTSLQIMHQTSGATAKSLYLSYQVAGKLKNTIEQSAFSDALDRNFPDSEEAKSLRAKRQLSAAQ